MPEETPSPVAQVGEAVGETVREKISVVAEKPVVSHTTDAIGDISRVLFERLPYIVLALVLFGAFLLLARWIRTLVYRLVFRDGKFLNTALLLARSAYAALIVVGALVSLAIAVPGFTPGQLVSALGFVSVALGFAFRDVLSNWLAGLFILLGEPFRVGDAVSFGGVEGTVEEVQTRATLVKSWDGRRVVVPNAKLFTDNVSVDSAFPTRRVDQKIFVEVDTNLDAAREAVLGVLRANANTQNEPAPRVLVAEFEQGRIALQLFWWIKTREGYDVLTARDEVSRAAKRALDEAGVKLASGPMSSM